MFLLLLYLLLFLPCYSLFLCFNTCLYVSASAAYAIESTSMNIYATPACTTVILTVGIPLLFLNIVFCIGLTAIILKSWISRHRMSTDSLSHGTEFALTKAAASKNEPLYEEVFHGGQSQLVEPIPCSENECYQNFAEAN